MNKFFALQMKFLKNPFLLSFTVSFVFFLISLLTLKDYGVSWDDAMHYKRAHTLMYYFLTGEKDYRNLPQTNFQGSQGNPNKVLQPRRSFYQNDSSNYQYFYDDWGHPPLNGLIAASFNYIFYQKLGWMDDISSHHLFNLVVSTFLVFIVTYFAITILGKFAGLVSFLTLTTYPLFFAESHFNVKDPAETAFIATTIFCFYKSLDKKSLKWLLLSILFFGLALGTKFNALFLPLIILPYLLIRYKPKLKDYKKLLNSGNLRYILFLCLVGPLIAIVLLVIPWPYLSSNWDNIFRIFRFYKEIGTGTNYQGQNFSLAGFNTFPILWIIFTTPILTLTLTLVGIITVFLKKNFKDKLSILWLIWLIVPIFRVSLPGTSIYGGIRQIMEFLPAMALLSGLGAWQLREWLVQKAQLKSIFVISLVILMSFIFPILTIINYHPYQNIYFNPLIGGLKGAREKNFPSWGNSYGNAYYEGIKWINLNAEPNSKLTLIQGERVNVPDILVRKDIDFGSNNRNFSGINRKGEYIMELTFNDTARLNYYAWDYVEKFLIPIYQVKIDDVPILKIWKNDLDHTKAEYRLDEKMQDLRIETSLEKNIIKINFLNPLRLSRLVLHTQNKNGCKPIQNGIIEISENGNIWKVKKDQLNFIQVKETDPSTSSDLNYFFADELAQYMNVKIENLDACILIDPKVEVYYFK